MPPTWAPPTADVIRVGWWDRPVDEPDLASWAWHRATGAAVAVLVATVAVAAGATLIDGVLMLALLVVVPTAAPLVPGGPAAAAAVLLAAGVPAAAALLFDAGHVAGALVLPWLLVTTTGAGSAAWGWWTGDRGVRDLLWPAACGYLAFGSLWLLADRTGYELAGFGPPFVQLTAVHFTYAGFVATALAGCAWARRPDDRLAATAAIAIAGAPPFVAIGFAAVGSLQIVGAVLLTVGTYVLAWVTLRHVVPTVRPLAAWTLGASAVSVLIPMLLAVQWAVGANLGTPALSIPQMAATHGVANAVGFALLGTVGWRSSRAAGRQERQHADRDDLRGARR